MLFVERARAVRPDFNLTAENFRAVAAICARLDGLPLVIELMAARMRLMSPQALLERLSGQFVLTADGMRAASERQKTLWNAIDWSYNLLSAEEQKLFACLSVFSGGFTMPEAEAIFADAVTEKTIPELLALLLDKSLIRRVANMSNEDVYEMLVTIREYAHEHLQNTDEETEVRNWHLAYFLNLAEEADRHIHGPDQITWMNRLDWKQDNFRTALDWSVASQQTDVALRLVNALCWPWLMRTQYSEIRSGFEKVRSLPNGSAYPPLYARLLNFMGHMNWLLGEYREAESFIQESQAIWLGLGPAGERGLAEALKILGMVAYSGSVDLKVAQSFFEQSFELYEKHADQGGMAFDLHFLGWLAIRQNNDSTTFALLEKSMSLFEQLGDIWGKSRVAQALGEFFLRQGNYKKARSYFEQNLEFDEQIKLKPGIVVALSSLGDLHRLQQDYIQARQYYEKSLEISRTYGMKEDWGLSLYMLGLLALHQNDYSAARQYFVDYIKAERGSFNKFNAYVFISSQAAISAGTDQPERAARLSGAAQTISESLGYQISRYNQAEFDRHIQMAREQLGTDKFENLANVGRAMTMEQAIAYALEDAEN
jgi:tetratricopeptide (TPR) repeat protein